MSLIETIQDKYNELNTVAGNGLLGSVRQKAFAQYNKMGIPTSRNEEWKYTRLGSLTNKNYALQTTTVLPSADVIDNIRLKSESAAELFFVNGVFPPVAAAMSMITEPLRILFNISSVINIGAFFPGIQKRHSFTCIYAVF